MSPINLTPADLWRGPFKKKLIWGLAVCFIVLLAFSTYVGSQPFSCKICHRLEFSSWRNSPHNQVPCAGCHDTSSPANFVKRLSEYGLFITGQYKSPITTKVKDFRCLGCHDKDIRGEQVPNNSPLYKKGEGEGIKISHSGFRGGKLWCTDCHKEAVHNLASSAANHRNSMGKCLDCHEREAVSSSGDCSTCHVNPAAASESWKQISSRREGSLWFALHGNDVDKNHGAANRKSCTFCHVNKDCSRCHGSVYPHYELWLTYHGSYKEGCSVCHRKNFCLSCHGTEMPHQINWKKGHAKAASDRKVCTRCHSAQDCENCHYKHLHPQVQGLKMNTRIFEDAGQ